MQKSGEKIIKDEIKNVSNIFHELFLESIFKLCNKLWLYTDRGSSMNGFVKEGEGEGGKNHILPCHSDPTSPIWTQIGTTKQLDPKNKSVTAFLKFLKIDLTRRGQR